jgi:putative ABC transport system permease protein
VNIPLLLIELLTPRREREWVVGDVVEELERITRTSGPAPARRWLRREALRVLADAPRHRFAVRRKRPKEPRSEKGDGPMSAVWQDVRYAFRLLGRSPGFTLIAVLTLALGIGANTAMFAVVNAVLLKPLPFSEPDRLMLVHMLYPDQAIGPGIVREGVWSYPKYRTFLDLQHSFDDVAIFSGRDFSLAGDANPERLRGEVVSERYPSVLGIGPLFGRPFTWDEANRPGATPVVMIGHGLWTRRYASDPSILGHVVQVNGTPHTIVGVLPQGFRGLSGDADLWVPLAIAEGWALTERYSHSYNIVARRKAGVSEREAIVAVQVNGWQINEQYRDRPDVSQAWGAVANSMYGSRADVDVRRAAFVVLGAVGFVLLIACVNLTNLLAAKAIARRREVAIRVAVGASRAGIVRQFTVESVVLAALGACAGVMVAWGLLSAAAALLPDSDVFFRTSMAPGVPRISGAAGLTRIGASMIGLDPTTLLFTIVLTIATALFVALLPAFQASALRPFDTLKSAGSSGTARGHHIFSARSLLVATQIALALVLLIGAGLMIRSAARLQATSTGVQADGVLTMRFDLPRASYSSETGTLFYTHLLERVRSLPGVEAAALANCAPVSGGCNTTSIWFPPTPRLGAGSDLLVGVFWATPDYFSTLGIQLLKGRNFSERDRSGQPKVALVNEAAVRMFWPNADPIGKTIAIGQGGFHDGAQVIGVVSSVRYRTLETAATPDVYIPLTQSFQPRMRLFVRSRLDERTLVGGISREVRALDPNLPIAEIKTMQERIGDAMWRTRIGVWLLSAFAALALLLTAIGIFGVMAQTVMQRTSEIGIRMALGARRHDVLALVLGRGAIVTAVGIAVGIGCALAITRLIGMLLYDVAPHDPLTFAVVGLTLTVVALVACYIPARRATRVDAVTALRSE